MLRNLLPASLLLLTTSACGMGMMGDDATAGRSFEASVDDLRFEAIAHADRAAVARTPDELREETDRHDLAMSDSTDRMRSRMSGMSCSSGMSGMSDRLDAMDEMMASHRDEVAAAATVEEGQRVCALHSEELLSRADELSARAGGMSCRRQAMCGWDRW